jgi:hypothetical protein
MHITQRLDVIKVHFFLRTNFSVFFQQMPVMSDRRFPISRRVVASMNQSALPLCRHICQNLSHSYHSLKCRYFKTSDFLSESHNRSTKNIFLPPNDSNGLPVHGAILNLLLLLLLMSRVSSSSIVSGYGLDDRAIGVRSPAGARDFPSCLCVQTGSGAHPASRTMGTGGPFPGGKSAARA